MKVSELIEMLEEQDPEAEVLIMSQQSWPFEYTVRGLTTRDELLRAESGDEEDATEEPADGCARSDVFLVEGEQLRYGAKAAWDLATR